MAQSSVDRDGLAADLERARTDFHHLLDSTGADEWTAPTNGTRWTNEELLFHMVFGYMIVQKLLILVRVFGRLPGGASRANARFLNAVTGPFDVINFYGSRLAARVYNRRRMGAKMDRVIASLQRSLRREKTALTTPRRAANSHPAAPASTAACHTWCRASASGIAEPRIAPIAAGPAPDEKRQESTVGTEFVEVRAAEADEQPDDGHGLHHRTRRYLAQRNSIEELGIGHPVVTADSVGLHEWDDHEPAAAGQRPDLEGHPTHSGQPAQCRYRERQRHRRHRGTGSRTQSPPGNVTGEEERRQAQDHVLNCRKACTVFTVRGSTCGGTV